MGTTVYEPYILNLTMHLNYVQYINVLYVIIEKVRQLDVHMKPKQSIGINKISRYFLLKKISLHLGSKISRSCKNATPSLIIHFI